MRDNEGMRCTRCRGELRAMRRLAGGPRMLVLAFLSIAMGLGLMALSPPRPFLAIPATLLLSLGLAILLRREILWVCRECRVLVSTDRSWFERRATAPAWVPRQPERASG